jgi:hypothetical protein
MARMYKCPVCAHPRLECKPYEIWPPPEGVVLEPPYENQLGAASYEVCVRCAFEFGFDDNPGAGEGTSFDAYRRRWVELGRPWLDEKYRTEDPDPPSISLT